MRRRRNAGFTLIEMLLALTLLSLIVGAILSGLHLGKRVWETGRDYEGVHEVEEAAAAVAELLSRSHTIVLPRPNDAPAAYFNGKSSSCRLVTTSQGDSQWGGLLLTEVGMVSGSKGATLAVWTRVFRPDDKPDLPRDDLQMTPALRDVTAFELNYFGAGEQDRPPAWSNVWSNRLQPPKLISLHIAAKRFGRIIDTVATVELRQR